MRTVMRGTNIALLGTNPVDGQSMMTRIGPGGIAHAVKAGTKIQTLMAVNGTEVAAKMQNARSE
jgi:hypothetical protein